MYCDNEMTIHIVDNPVFPERTKHIEINRYSTCEKLEDGTICTPHVKTKTGSQLADFITKALHGLQIFAICNKMRMINIYDLACGGV